MPPVDEQQPIEKGKLIDKVGALSTTLPSNGSSLVSAAKVQQNFETTKDKEQKKELPPVTPLGTNRRGISKAAQKFGEQRDFKAPQALSGDTELTARAANVLNSVAKVQQNFETAKDKEKKHLTISAFPLQLRRHGTIKSLFLLQNYNKISKPPKI